MSAGAMSRRNLLFGVATFPLLGIATGAFSSALVGCGAREPETPLAHLYGKEWVDGAFKMYASRYAEVEQAAEQKSEGVYRLLAHKGIDALSALQVREVPFFIKVDEQARAFRVERDVPDRLMFTANMGEADRERATSRWNKARDHIHTDYEEIRRLNRALTVLFQQLQSVRNAVEEGRFEQYRLVSQLAALRDGGKPPFELPYQVAPKDYSEILLLVLERLENDRRRLEHVEGDIVSVGLVTRATDAGSATLATSIQKVLLAVSEEDEEAQRPVVFPESDERKKLLSVAEALRDKIGSSAEYVAWQKAERAKKFEALGQFLSLLDSMTGLPASAIYRQAVSIINGDGDYLTHLKSLAHLLPMGKQLTGTLSDAIDTTERARKISGQALAIVRGGAPKVDDLVDVGLKKGKSAILNAGSDFARERIDKQLSFFTDKLEVAKVKERFAESPLMKAGVVPNFN